MLKDDLLLLLILPVRVWGPGSWIADVKLGFCDLQNANNHVRFFFSKPMVNSNDMLWLKYLKKHHSWVMTGHNDSQQISLYKQSV